MTSLTIQAIPAFKDNYVWLLHNGQKAIVVDPGDATPVMANLSSQSLELTEIWVTHHHPDHVGGVAQLLKAFAGAGVRAPSSSPLPHVTHFMHEGSQFALFGDTLVNVWHIPGHTPDHISFLFDMPSGPALFCGDTLFGGGCGRLFGGTAEQLFTSLNRIARLPDTTHIYCAHEYTESNLRFALHIEPDNVELQKRVQIVHAMRANNESTIPALLAEELKTNPFLRTWNASVSHAILRHYNKKEAQPSELFADLRAWKDVF